MHRTVRTNLSDADGEQTIEERVLRLGGLEPRHGVEIVGRVVARRLWAEPNDGGPGATFSFWIPRQAQSLDAVSGANNS